MRTTILTILLPVLLAAIACGQPVSRVTQAPVPTQETPIQPTSPPEPTEAATETGQAPTAAPSQTSVQTSVPALVDDFQPPTGLDLESPAESPGRFRLLTAKSTDGLTFRPTGQIISDQANVPDMVMDTDGRIFLYYTGWEVGARKNATAVAISIDNGSTWTFKHVEFQGFGPGAPVDPDIVLLPDGTFRMYVTTGVAGRIGIVFAESADGFTFTQRGVAFAQPDEDVLDSTTFFFDDRWHMLVLAGQTTMQWYATSPDGQAFSPQEKLSFLADNSDYVAANGVTAAGGFRMYAFAVPRKNLLSFFSADGMNWVQEDGVRLQHDPNSTVEGSYIKDPAVLQLADGSYLMVYVSRIPE